MRSSLTEQADRLSEAMKDYDTIKSRLTAYELKESSRVVLDISIQASSPPVFVTTAAPVFDYCEEQEAADTDSTMNIRAPTSGQNGPPEHLLGQPQAGTGADDSQSIYETAETQTDSPKRRPSAHGSTKPSPLVRDPTKSGCKSDAAPDLEAGSESDQPVASDHNEHASDVEDVGFDDYDFPVLDRSAHRVLFELEPSHSVSERFLGQESDSKVILPPPNVPTFSPSADEPGGPTPHRRKRPRPGRDYVTTCEHCLTQITFDPIIVTVSETVEPVVECPRCHESVLVPRHSLPPGAEPGTYSPEQLTPIEQMESLIQSQVHEIVQLKQKMRNEDSNETASTATSPIQTTARQSPVCAATFIADDDNERFTPGQRQEIMRREEAINAQIDGLLELKDQISQTSGEHTPKTLELVVLGEAEAVDSARFSLEPANLLFFETELSQGTAPQAQGEQLLGTRSEQLQEGPCQGPESPAPGGQYQGPQSQGQYQPPELPGPDGLYQRSGAQFQSQYQRGRSPGAGGQEQGPGADSQEPGGQYPAGQSPGQSPASPSPSPWQSPVWQQKSPTVPSPADGVSQPVSSNSRSSDALIQRQESLLQELSSAKSENTTLRAAHDQLKDEIGQLKARHGELASQHQDVQATVKDLRLRHEEIVLSLTQAVEQARTATATAPAFIEQSQHLANAIKERESIQKDFEEMSTILQERDAQLTAMEQSLRTKEKDVTVLTSQCSEFAASLEETRMHVRVGEDRRAAVESLASDLQT
jgi:cob(I)alamin adenosyltransferase